MVLAGKRSGFGKKTDAARFVPFVFSAYFLNISSAEEWRKMGVKA